MGKKILGSYIIMGILLGIILGVIIVYFLSQVLNLIYVLIIAVVIFFGIAVIGFWKKKNIKNYKLLQFDIKLLNSFY